MGKWISVVDCKPDGRKKGLRIEVKEVKLDENDNLTELYFEYSGWHTSGGCIVEVSQKYNVELPRE